MLGELLPRVIDDARVLAKPNPHPIVRSRHIAESEDTRTCRWSANSQTLGVQPLWWDANRRSLQVDSVKNQVCSNRQHWRGRSAQGPSGGHDSLYFEYFFTMASPVNFERGKGMTGVGTEHAIKLSILYPVAVPYLANNWSLWSIIYDQPSKYVSSHHCSLRFTTGAGPGRSGVGPNDRQGTLVGLQFEPLHMLPANVHMATAGVK